MHNPLSELPLTVSPSLAAKYGLEEALLLGVYQQLFSYVGQPSGSNGIHMLLTRRQWAGLVSFWDEKAHARVTARLVELGVITVEYRASEVYIRQSFDGHTQSAPVTKSHDAPEVSHLPVRDTPPLPAKPFMQYRTAKDELQQIFEQTEIEKQLRRPMTLDWKPSTQFYQLIKRFNIERSFAEQQLDEFTLYWSSRDRKEANWDQKFLNWVKKAQAFQKDSAARQESYGDAASGTSANHLGNQYENARRDSKENRKRVTKAIMDIQDTDW